MHHFTVFCFSLILLNYFVFSDSLLRLKKDLRHTTLSAFAHGTSSNLQTQFRAFLLFTTFFDLQPLPASLETVTLYAQFLSRSMVPSAIKNYISGAKMLHILLGYEYTHSNNALLAIVYKGIARNHPYVPRKAVPITDEILVSVAKVVSSKSPHETAVFAVALFSFFLMARLGNVLPQSISNCKQQQYLTHGDINAVNDHILVTFRHTKTRQMGSSFLHLPLLRMPGSPICPVSAFLLAQQFHTPSVKEPAFMIPKANKFVPLTSGTFVQIFRALLRKANIDNASRYTGHSFRRGGASFAFKAGLPGEYIQLAGDWKSDAYKSYIDVSLETKLRFASQIMNNITLL